MFGAVRVATALLILLTTNAATAQISGGATLVSDYRYRGISLSQGEPQAQADMAYDSHDGWYAGGLASGAKFAGTHAEQFVVYGGHTGPVADGLSWDAGASGAAFVQASAYNYAEAYVGLASENCSGRVYYSPSYLNQKAHTVYAELNATYPLQENVHLLGHFGILHQLSGSDTSPSESGSRYDGRIGISARIAEWVVELAWVALQKKSSLYPAYEDRNPRTVVLSVAYSF